MTAADIVAILSAAAALVTAVSALLHSWQTRKVADGAAAGAIKALARLPATGPPTGWGTGPADIAK